MGWTVPWYSTFGERDFNADCGAPAGNFGLSAFLRDGPTVFRTYHTAARGADRLRIDFNLRQTILATVLPLWPAGTLGQPEGRFVEESS